MRRKIRDIKIKKEEKRNLPVKYLSYPYGQDKTKKDNLSNFREIFKQLQINIPLAEALEKMPTYAKFMKELLAKKRRFIKEETIELEARCSSIIHKSLLSKSKDLSNFTIPVTIGVIHVENTLLDFRANINPITLSMMKMVGNSQVQPT